MARIRTVKPDYWTDEKVVELSIPARLLFIGLLNYVDDDGRMPYSPKRIKLQIFPADDITPQQVEAMIAEMCDLGMAQLYKVNDLTYLCIRNFNKHQKIDKRSKSKYPAPPDWIGGFEAEGIPE